MVGSEFYRSNFNSSEAFVTDLSLDRDSKPNCWVVVAVSFKSTVHLFWVDEEVTEAKSVLSKSSQYVMSYFSSNAIDWTSITVASTEGFSKYCLLRGGKLIVIYFRVKDHMTMEAVYLTATVKSRTCSITTVEKFAVDIDGE